MNLSAIKPGDVLGIGGGKSPLNRWINLGSYGWPWSRPLAWQGLSHVAVVFQHGISLAICEATTLCRSSCIVCSECHDGVQVHPLDRRVRQYIAEGRTVWHYPLVHRLSEWSERRLNWFLETKHSTPYDYPGAIDANDLVIGRLKRKWFGHEGLTSLYCSELCPAALRYSGVWDEPNVTGYSPNRFCREGVRRGVLAYPGVVVPETQVGLAVAEKAA